MNKYFSLHGNWNENLKERDLGQNSTIQFIFKYDKKRTLLGLKTGA
jgi:hypothetical protein